MNWNLGERFNAYVVKKVPFQKHEKWVLAHWVVMSVMFAQIMMVMVWAYLWVFKFEDMGIPTAFVFIFQMCICWCIVLISLFWVKMWKKVTHWHDGVIKFNSFDDATQKAVLDGNKAMIEPCWCCGSGRSLSLSDGLPFEFCGEEGEYEKCPYNNTWRCDVRPKDAPCKTRVQPVTKVTT